MEYKEGEIYCGINGTGQNNRFVWLCRVKDQLAYTAWLHLSANPSFVNTTGNHSWGENRLATPQEKEHLLQCIAAGKYVDYKPSNKIVYGYQIL